MSQYLQVGNHKLSAVRRRDVGGPLVCLGTWRGLSAPLEPVPGETVSSSWVGGLQAPAETHAWNVSVCHRAMFVKVPHTLLLHQQGRQRLPDKQDRERDRFQGCSGLGTLLSCAWSVHWWWWWWNAGHRWPKDCQTIKICAYCAWLWILAISLFSPSSFPLLATFKILCKVQNIM